MLEGHLNSTSNITKRGSGQYKCPIFWEWTEKSKGRTVIQRKVIRWINPNAFYSVKTCMRKVSQFSTGIHESQWKFSKANMSVRVVLIEIIKMPKSRHFLKRKVVSLLEKTHRNWSRGKDFGRGSLAVNARWRIGLRGGSEGLVTRAWG